ncbi:hypothetical protein FF125_17155 [Aureibaculum algae]|uniref:Uncharacterized protein n=1 Tax=Aureibaculum algae TaxID=2584122 RepID=A0A5B7TT72_9FLAO|nr:hypothetical protein [Aureibaculum algae]QCX40089.1 hypothetical protein FF125_17155 [Aureibaculum algae]
MKLKSLFLILTIFISNLVIGQSLDDYKYVIIPAKYEFQKTDDQYQLNSLTKFLFEKEGFITHFDNEVMPSEIAKNPCDVLTARVSNTSNMFTTKMVVELINCKNEKVLITKEGRSKEKDYKKGYQEALREAFESVTAQNYNKENTENSKSAIVQSSVQEAKNAVAKAADAVEEAAEEVEVIEATEVEMPEEINEIEVEEIEETMIDSSEDVERTKYDNRDRDDNGTILSVPTEKLLYAQKNRLGYQLVDSSPKIVFILLNSSKKEVYYIKNRSGIFFKEDGKWYAEYYFDGHLMKQEFDVKW